MNWNQNNWNKYQSTYENYILSTPDQANRHIINLCILFLNFQISQQMQILRK